MTILIEAARSPYVSQQSYRFWQLCADYPRFYCIEAKILTNSIFCETDAKIGAGT